MKVIHKKGNSLFTVGWKRLRNRLRAALGDSQSWYHTDFPPHPRKIIFGHTRSGGEGRIEFRTLIPAFKETFDRSALLQSHPSLETPEWQTKTAEFPALPIIEVSRARTVSSRGPVITDDNVLISELSRLPCPCPSGIIHPLLLGEGYPESRVVRKKGIYGLAHTTAGSTYHWIYETLPRLELLRKAGYTWDKLDGIFLRRPQFEAHYATLDLLGIPKEKIVWCLKNSHFAAEKIVASPVPIVSSYHPAWVHQFLRALPGFPLEAYKAEKRRILISRGEGSTKRRRVLNQKELAKSLKESFGFEEVQLASLSFLDQVRVFASAEWIISPHGAGLSNLTFAPEGAKVIEIFTPEYTPIMFRNIAWETGLHYQATVGTAVAPEEPSHFGADIVADIASVHQLFRQMEASLPRF